MKNRWQEKSVDFRIAQEKDIPAIAQLYTACFGDEAAEAEEFLRLFFQSSDFRLLLAEKNKSVISMLAMIPARLAKGKACFYCGFYLYGIGTFPSFRGQGLSSDLMDLAKKMASSLNYDFLFLVPASESLISFYEKQGFFTASLPAASSDTSDPTTISSDFSGFTAISLKEYLALRTKLENETGVFSLLEPFRTYALEMIQEHLHFYKEVQAIQNAKAALGQTEYGICFYGEEKRPPLQFLEQTEPSFTLSGGLVHQIFPLRRLSLPSSTYFQFPMDELSSYF